MENLNQENQANETSEACPMSSANSVEEIKEPAALAASSEPLTAQAAAAAAFSKAAPPVNPQVEQSTASRAWYVVQTASGHETKVKGHIEKRIETMEVWDRIFAVVVPERTVTRVKKGKRVEKKEKEYPGYVLVEMLLDEATWRTVREAPGVLGFIGNKNKPAPISEAEVRKILRKSAVHTTPKVGEKTEIDLKIGETVKIQAGPFEDFLGEVAEINEEKMTVKVNVVVFGRSTPTEVPVNHVDRVG